MPRGTPRRLSWLTQQHVYATTKAVKARGITIIKSECYPFHVSVTHVVNEEFRKFKRIVFNIGKTQLTDLAESQAH